mgnify:CR=1 FL=1
MERQNREEAENIDEQEVLKRLHRGDPAGLEALIERYTPYVAAIAARMMPGCPQEWEELTADVFLCAWRERKKLQPGKVKSWLARVARNRALNRLRDRRELLPLEEDVLVLAQDSPQRELENREAAQLVRAALETLEPSDRELFVRHYYYGQTVEKAAEEMGMNRSTAKTRLRRGREKLKRQLEREGYIFEED